MSCVQVIRFEVGIKP